MWSLVLLVFTGSVNAYLLGDDTQLCWLDGQITDCAGLEGITVQWVKRPPSEIVTAEPTNVSCNVTWDNSPTVVPKSDGGDLVNHINIHSCNDNVILCVPAVGPDIATHSPAQSGGVDTYNHSLKLPKAGVWTTICHARIYTNQTGTKRKIDAAIAHFGIVVSDPPPPPLPPTDLTPIIASATVSGGVLLITLVVVSVSVYILKKNDVMIKYEDIVFEGGSGARPWQVTGTSEIYRGTFKGMAIAIKKIKAKNSRGGPTKANRVAPDTNKSLSPLSKSATSHQKATISASPRATKSRTLTSTLTNND